MWSILKTIFGLMWSPYIETVMARGANAEKSTINWGNIKWAKRCNTDVRASKRPQNYPQMDDKGNFIPLIGIRTKNYQMALSTRKFCFCPNLVNTLAVDRGSVLHLFAHFIKVTISNWSGYQTTSLNLATLASLADDLSAISLPWRR